MTQVKDKEMRDLRVALTKFLFGEPIDVEHCKFLAPGGLFDKYGVRSAHIEERP